MRHAGSQHSELCVIIEIVAILKSSAIKNVYFCWFLGMHLRVLHIAQRLFSHLHYHKLVFLHSLLKQSKISLQLAVWHGYKIGSGKALQMGNDQAWTRSFFVV